MTVTDVYTSVTMVKTLVFVKIKGKTDFERIGIIFFYHS